MTDQIVYVTYIRASAEKLWQALTDPLFMRQYTFGLTMETDWKKGSPYRMVRPDGRQWESGAIVEIDKPRRLVLSWNNEQYPRARDAGPSIVTYDLEPWGDAIKLTVTHRIPVKAGKDVEGLYGGWEMVLASLKSLLETGQALERTTRWPEGL